MGYLTYGTDAANMLFHVVNDRHRKKRAMIFTTNKSVTAWGRVLHDEDLAHAIVDRILERGRLLTLDGPSLRTKHLGLDDPTSSEALDQPARISGIDAPEFPEPTASTVLRPELCRPIYDRSCVATRNHRTHSRDRCDELLEEEALCPPLFVASGASWCKMV